jgi:PAS domain S-box-containing protein
MPSPTKKHFCLVPWGINNKMAPINPEDIAFASRDTFREIFQTSAEGIIMIDVTGKILLSNPVSEKMFGFAPETLVGHGIEDLLPARYRGKHLDFRRQFNEQPEPRRMGVGRDLKALRFDGSEFPVEISLSFTKVNKHVLSIAFITDISLRKVAEEALKRSEEQLIEYAAELEKKVKSRTEALNLSVHKLEELNKDLQEQILVRERAEEETRKALEKERELNELKSKFVSIASHEFRTPLSAILSSTSLIQQYHQRGEISKMDKHIFRVKSSIHHLTSILNDFLSLGKLEESRIEVAAELVALHSFFEEIKEELKPTLKEEQQLIIHFNQPELNFQSDPRILRGVLFNLVSNASKYSNSGKSIHLTATYTDESLTIEVRDEGIGIPQPEVKHIFERFFRASNSSHIQGTGLGLNIVKRYIELLDGMISFSSELGKGSSFVFTLPLNRS